MKQWVSVVVGSPTLSFHKPLLYAVNLITSRAFRNWNLRRRMVWIKSNLLRLGTKADGSCSRLKADRMLRCESRPFRALEDHWFSGCRGVDTLLWAGGKRWLRRTRHRSKQRLPLRSSQLPTLAMQHDGNRCKIAPQLPRSDIHRSATPRETFLLNGIEFCTEEFRMILIFNSAIGISRTSARKNGCV